MSMIGSRLAHYQLTAKLGAGGMGEVYRALDTRLEREVALKVLAGGLAASPDYLQRFRREAMALASLNHPGIVTIYSVEEAEGTCFLTMELVEGEPLSELLPAGGFPVPELLRLAEGLGEALAAAHRSGVVHRDLKPGNVMVAADGLVKVLDFGLAKTRRDGVPPASATAATDLLTRPGVVLGTVAYMSPEQAEGRAVDERSDLFSLGVMLWEMATGRRPFRGGSSMAVVSSILRDEPPALGSLRDDLPQWLCAGVGSCLEKDPVRRPRDAVALMEQWRRRERYGGEPRPPEDVPRPSREGFFVAVLPLRSLSAEQDQEPLADGMTEALITRLAQEGGIKVISSSSSMRFKGAGQPLREIASRLQVENVVEGTVLRSGSQIRVTARLVRASTEESLWAESYRRPLDDVLALQDEIAAAIAGQIGRRLHSGPVPARAGASPVRKVSPAAYEAYLTGRHHWNQRTEERVLRALECFKEAVDLDPVYALAYVGVADCYLVLGSQELRPPAECFPYCKAAVLKALEIEDLAEAHATLAAVLHDWDWDWDAAAGEYRRALELNPGYARTHHWHAEFLTAAGRLEEARLHYGRARELDPLSLSMHNDLAWHYLVGDEPERSIAECRRVLDLDRGFLPARLTLAWAQCCCGDFDGAVEELERVLAAAPDSCKAIAGLGHAHARAQRHDLAVGTLARLERLAQERYVSHVSRAVVHAGLGAREELFASLEKAEALRERELAYLFGTPAFRGLEREPRFRELLARVGPRPAP
jgi:serine/threonine-protein kinase